ncbi:MAG: CoA transferase [Pseudomonadota bacterium]
MSIGLRLRPGSPGRQSAPGQPGSVGDLTGGATLAGAIAAALFRRERTGRGAVVDHSPPPRAIMAPKSGVH